MTHKAKRNIPHSDLAKLVDEFDPYENHPTVMEDVSSVKFDFENWISDPEDGFNMPGFVPGYETLPNGTTVFWTAAGGDWEMPVALCLYMGDDGLLHAYVPDAGNSYNRQEARAWTMDEISAYGVKYEFNMRSLSKEASERI